MDCPTSAAAPPTADGRCGAVGTGDRSGAACLSDSVDSAAAVVTEGLVAAGIGGIGGIGIGGIGEGPRWQT